MTPRENPSLLGHDAAERTLRAAAASGRLHHAWLITGAEGIGKATLAYRFGRALLAGFPNGAEPPGLAVAPDHPVFRRVASGTHADLITLARPWDDKKKALKAEIPVDDARALAGFLALTPAEGGWRVVVIDQADALNRHAANAVLKLLEEPPPRTVLMLTASAPGRLLPTIRSRCRFLGLLPLGDDDCAEAIRRAAPAHAARAEALARRAEGSPGRALAWADEGLLALMARADALLDGSDPREAEALADAAARLEDGPASVAAALRAAIHRRVGDAVRSQGGTQGGALGPAERTWCEAWSAIGALERQARSFNLDRRQSILDGLERLRGS